MSELARMKIETAKAAIRRGEAYSERHAASWEPAQAEITAERAGGKPAEPAVEQTVIKTQEAAPPAELGFRSHMVAEPAGKLAAGPAQQLVEKALAEKPKAEPWLGEPLVELGAPILEPTAPYTNARVFATRCCREGNDQVVWFWEGEFWRWNGKHYGPEPNGKMRGRVYQFLEGAKKKIKGGHAVPFEPRPQHVNELVDGLKSGLSLSALPTAWLPAGDPARDCTAFANEIVNVKTGDRWPATPKFWTHGALAYDWNPAADAPTWRDFLKGVFPLDPSAPPSGENFDAESAQFIEEFFGCCMTDDVHLQKAAMLVGAERSGKGTINHILRELVGPAAHVGLDIHQWLRGEKSTQALLGKRVGVFGDVRLKVARRYGQTGYDPGGLPHEAKGWLLNLTSGDPVTVPRLFDTAWHGVLPIKLMMLSNEVPNLNDRVLPSRFVKVPFPVSFLGREDVTLKDRLMAELPGIAARCIAAYAKARKSGGFTQPKSGLALAAEINAKSDPFTKMAMECFVADAEGFITKGAAFSRFEAWCLAGGYGDLRQEVNTKGRLFDRLKQLPAFKGIFETQPHGSPRGWSGIRLAR